MCLFLQIDEETIRITELPIGSWTQKYQKFLEESTIGNEPKEKKKKKKDADADDEDGEGEKKVCKHNNKFRTHTQNNCSLLRHNKLPLLK